MLDFEIVSTISECTHKEFTYKMLDSQSGTTVYRYCFPHGKLFPREEVLTELGRFENTARIGFDTKVFSNKAQARDALCKLLLTKGE